MDIRVNSLKILSKIESITAVESSVLKVKGVVDSKIKKIDNYYKLEYAIDNWSSEYDVMVSIMETLKSEFSLESEPYVDEDYQDYNYDIQGDGESSNLEEDISFDSENISCDANNFNEDKEKHHHEHSHSHSHEHSGSMKVKLIELFVALGVFIIGVILNFIPKTEKFSQYLIVIAYSVAGYETLFEGLIGLFKGKVFSSNFLMTIASLAALILGETFEAFGIMFLFSVGELFERSATDSAQKVIDELIKLCPDTVTMLMDGVEKKVNVKQVEVGATVVLKAGDKVALDGKIISGSASFDSKAVTGESKLKDLCEDDLVFGGYVNLNGYVLVEVLKDYKNSTINKIMEIVESSYEKKSKKESFIEKFAKWYTPCVLVLALLIAFIPPIFSASYSAGLSVWGVRAIMLICVSCPCALAVSVPLTYFCGVGTAAKKGVLIKSTKTLEKLASCDTVVFDKTGTLTKGNLKVTKIISTKEYSGKLLKLVATLEQNSNHPIALAIKEKESVEKVELKNYKEIAGKGIICDYNGKNHILGNAKFLKENGVEFKESFELGTKLYLAVDGVFAGVVILNDELRDEAYGAIKELKDYGVYKSIMLTGDSREYAKSIRKELEMSVSVSELMPEDKVIEIEKLISENKGKTVAYVGDGINDAPVITRADVGFAMGALGSDSAIESADVVLTNDDLSKIPFTVRLSKRTNTIAKQNIVVALAVKFLVMILSVTGISSSLWLAISADVGVLVLAVLNAIRNRLD